MSKKELLLGNEAVARGLYEAGVRVVSSYPEHPAPKSPKMRRNTTKSTANGLPMKRWPWKWLPAPALAAPAPSAP